MIEIKEGKYTEKTIKTINKISKEMGDLAEKPKEANREISPFRYTKALQHLVLLRSMGEVDNKEVKRLISLLQSPDHENWEIAEMAIAKLLA
jgi:hypothetical protein